MLWGQKKNCLKCPAKIIMKNLMLWRLKWYGFTRLPSFEVRTIVSVSTGDARRFVIWGVLLSLTLDKVIIFKSLNCFVWFLWTNVAHCTLRLNLFLDFKGTFDNSRYRRYSIHNGEWMRCCHNKPTKTWF